MCRVCETTIDALWGKINIEQDFITPDKAAGSKYIIVNVGSKEINISPQKIIIRKKAFVATLHYLTENRHNINNQIIIQSNNDPMKAGPLCKVSRGENSGTRCINYIIPILHLYGIVGIYSGRPNRTWLNSIELIDV